MTLLQSLTSFLNLPRSPIKACGGVQPLRLKRLVCTPDGGCKVSENCSFLMWLKMWGFASATNVEVLSSYSSVAGTEIWNVSVTPDDLTPQWEEFSACDCTVQQSLLSIDVGVSVPKPKCSAQWPSSNKLPVFTSTQLTLLRCLLLSLLSRLANFDVPSCKTKARKFSGSSSFSTSETIVLCSFSGCPWAFRHITWFWILVCQRLISFDFKTPLLGQRGWEFLTVLRKKRKFEHLQCWLSELHWLLGKSCNAIWSSRTAARCIFYEVILLGW